ncbi:hypothetical protein [Stappia sp.]|uniref:hypothetical protein n=1 Tax=Stappia sp. TaxID=1870903 RepID=UPI0032D9A494
MMSDDTDTTEGREAAGLRTGGPGTTDQERTGPLTAKVRQAGPVAKVTGRSAGPGGGHDRRVGFDPGIALDPTAEPAYRFVPDVAPDFAPDFAPDVAPDVAPDNGPGAS